MHKTLEVFFFIFRFYSNFSNANAYKVSGGVNEYNKKESGKVSLFSIYSYLFSLRLLLYGIG